MAIEKDLLGNQPLAGRDPKEVFNKDGLVDELKKVLSERILNTELDEHLDGDGAEGKSNHRNGYSKKSVLTGTSKMTLSVPRDRAGTFDPKADRQVPAPVSGFRQQDHLDVCARDDGWGVFAAISRQLDRHRGFAGPDLGGH